MIIEKPKSFNLDNKDFFLFFDIFFKNNMIYLILPIYNKPYNDKNIKITFNDNILSINEKLIKYEYEPISIFKYDINTNNDIIDITVEFNNITKKFNLTRVNEKKKYLTLSTLIFNDYKLISIFYDYYIKQGVEYFYFYYNGYLNKDIIDKFNKYNITLIEWPFRYWNCKKTCKFSHHAQLGSLNHALYKYGKDFSEYMIFNDLDEYMHIPNTTLSNSLKKNNYDIMQFCNRWSVTLDNKIPEKFPLKFKTSSKINYPKRSKNIYRCNLVEKIGIHFCKFFNKSDLKIKKNLDMFHFYNWTKLHRKQVVNKIIELPEIVSNSKE